MKDTAEQLIAEFAKKGKRRCGKGKRNRKKYSMH